MAQEGLTVLVQKRQSNFKMSFLLDINMAHNLITNVNENLKD